MRNPFRHRQQIRKRKKVTTPNPFSENNTFTHIGRIGAGSPNAQMFQKNPTTNVVFSTSSRYPEGMSGKEGNMKSHRIAMAQALIAELAEAVERHGDTSGTQRLRAMVARMVAELLA